jgi:hypothetical protein
MPMTEDDARQLWEATVKWFWRIGGMVSIVVSVVTFLLGRANVAAARADVAAAIAERSAAAELTRQATLSDSALVTGLNNFAGKIEWSGDLKTKYVITGFCGRYVVNNIPEFRDALRMARRLDRETHASERSCDQ